MFCKECLEEMVPLKGSICASGIDTCFLPCWTCPSCGFISYLHSETEFDKWIDEYTEIGAEEPEEDLGLFLCGIDDN